MKWGGMLYSFRSVNERQDVETEAICGRCGPVPQPAMSSDGHSTNLNFTTSSRIGDATALPSKGLEPFGDRVENVSSVVSILMDPPYSVPMMTKMVGRCLKPEAAGIFLGLRQSLEVVSRDVIPTEFPHLTVSGYIVGCYSRLDGFVLPTCCKRRILVTVCSAHPSWFLKRKVAEHAPRYCLC